MNGSKYLLDTNIILNFLKRDILVLELFVKKQIKLNECAFSSITRMELLSYSNLTEIETKAIEKLLSQMTYFSVTTEIENVTIKFRRLHKTKLPDSIIAATAKYYQLELLTLDKKLAAVL
jgi:predicted nucleic acid-binding protein